MQVVEEAARLWGVDRVILIPDEFLARNVARQTHIKIIAWQGRCEVHERFSAADILEIRESWPDAEILAHPECPAEVLELADFAGSTAAMNDYVIQRKPKRVVLITECSMADNVAAELPEVEFVRPCNLCPHMKRITLPKIVADNEALATQLFTLHRWAGFLVILLAGAHIGGALMHFVIKRDTVLQRMLPRALGGI